MRTKAKVLQHNRLDAKFFFSKTLKPSKTCTKFFLGFSKKKLGTGGNWKKIRDRWKLEEREVFLRPDDADVHRLTCILLRL